LNDRLVSKFGIAALPASRKLTGEGHREKVLSFVMVGASRKAIKSGH
jgi:hypothetical protein